MRVAALRADFGGVCAVSYVVALFAGLLSVGAERHSKNGRKLTCSKSVVAAKNRERASCLIPKSECAYLHAYILDRRPRLVPWAEIALYKHQCPNIGRIGHLPAVVYLNITKPEQQVQALA